MPKFYWLEEIEPAQVNLVGEKALALSQLWQWGYPVVSGFVIPTSTFKAFLKRLGESDPLLVDLFDSALYIDVNDYEALQKLTHHIRTAILATPLEAEWLQELGQELEKLASPVLMVRPSVIIPQKREEHLGGLLAAQVCSNTLESVEVAIKRLWGDLFSAKSLFYRQRTAIARFPIHCAVLVQPLWEVEASGTVRTDAQGLEIQATWGLGKSWVQGEVVPDLYRIPLNPQRSMEKHLGHKTRAYQLQPITDVELSLEAIPLNEEQQNDYVLRPEALQELIQLVRNLADTAQEYFGLEWILCSSASSPRFYLTQFTLEQTPASSFSPPVMEQQVLLTGLAASPGRVIAPAQVILEVNHPLSVDIPPGSILVTKGLTPDWLPLLKHSIGIILETGGMTSHGAIIARELSIPALVGATQATQKIQTGDLLLLDATRGEVFCYSETSQSSETVVMSARKIPESPLPLPPERRMTPETPLATQLWVTLSQADGVAEAAELPVDGVGLLRAEVMMLSLLEHHPLDWWLKHSDQFENELRQQLEAFAVAFVPRPIFYRSTDWRFPEYPALGDGWEAGQNPALGMRGSYNYRLNPVLFEAELRALEAVHSRYQNFRLILPFVRSVTEFRDCRDRVEQVGLLRSPTFQLWIMAEVPSIIFLLEDYIRAGIQGIAIGTNDLSQLLLGVDRDNAQLSAFYQPESKALYQGIQQLIITSQKHNLPCSVCGQATQQMPDFVDHLIQWGVTAISVEAHAVESTYHKIARAEKRLLLEAARSFKNQTGS